MNSETHIAGLVVHARPENWKNVLHKAKQLPKAECHGKEEEAKFVLVVEVNSESALISCMDDINNWEGVLSVRLCYHHYEADELLNEEMPNENYTS